MSSKAIVVSFENALAGGDPPPGNLAIPIFAHGSLQAELYAPRGVDRQTPHSRDEVYVVAQGKGLFFDGSVRHSVQSGSFLFVPAGQEHRFEEFTSDFAVWVFFYGPEGGEASMDNVRLLKNLYEAFGRADIPAVLGAMSSGIRWYQAEGNPYMPSGEAWVGPDAVLENLFMKLGAEWDGFAVHTKSFYGAGDSVIVEARYTGTYKPTGKNIDAQVCHVWDVKDGKVTRFQQYLDTAQLQDAMGMRQRG